MSESIWTYFPFRITVTWVNLVSLFAILAYHSYRLCYLQKELTGSPIKLFKFISFKHLSFIVIIGPLLSQLQQAIIYTPHQLLLSDSMCRFNVIFGIVCLAIAKLALHLFIAMRSQVARGTTNIWYKIGLAMTLSDVLFIIYVVSPIPTIISIQDGITCKPINISLQLYIWFAMNDFVIGMYCLLAFILPLRKYVWLEEQQDRVSVVQMNACPNSPVPIQPKRDSELRSITKRIMIYSSIALISTMIFTVISSIINESGGPLFAIDSTVNALCVTLQFRSRPMCCKVFSRSASALGSHSSISRIVVSQTNVTPNSSKNKIEMIIHPTSAELEKAGKVAVNKPKLRDNASLSLSLVDNDVGGDLTND